MDARRWPVREERFVHSCEYSKSLEGDHGSDKSVMMLP